jgi:hypothetical protein
VKLTTRREQKKNQPLRCQIGPNPNPLAGDQGLLLGIDKSFVITCLLRWAKSIDVPANFQGDPRRRMAISIAELLSLE